MAKATLNQDLTTHNNITIIGGLMWQNELYTQAKKDAYDNDKNYEKVMDWDSMVEYAKSLRLRD